MLVSHVGYAIFSFLNVEFTDSSSKMSRTVKKVKKAIHLNSVWIHILVCHIGTAISYLFIYFQFTFVISNFKNSQLPNIKISEVRNDVRVCYKGILKYHKSRLGWGRNFVGKSVRIPVIAKNIMKVWNSSGVFFSYIIYYKILIVFP